MMKVTVAICTWNRCELLRQTLQQLTAAIVPAGMVLDVLVVNNNCTDDTDQVIDGFIGRLPVRRVFEPTPGLSNARNAALAASTGEYVIFTDDDVLVTESWLVEFEKATLAFPDAAAIGGIIEPWFPEPPDPELMDVFPSLRGGFCGLDHRRDAGPLPEGLGIWGANMAYRIDRIRSLRFDPKFGPSPSSTVCADETDFQRRLRLAGETIVWWPMMTLRHYVSPTRMSTAYLLRFTKGKGEEHVLTKPAGLAPSMVGVPRWLWLTLLKAVAGYPRGAVIADRTSRPPSTFSGRAESHATRRARSLAYRRELAFLLGMVRGYRRQHRETGTPAPPT